MTTPVGTTTPSSAFDPSSVQIGGSSQTYDAFGLPTGLANQTVYMGYQAPVSQNINPNVNPVGKQETEKVSDLLKDYAKLAQSPDQAKREAWVQLQQQLAAMGAYGSKTPNYGGFTSEDVTAVTNSIQSYLAGGGGTKDNPSTFADYVTAQAQIGAANNAANGQSATGSSSSAPSINLTDPASLTQTVNTAAKAALGRDLTPEESAAFVSQFQAAQSADQGSTAQTNTTPEASADAADYVKQQFASEYGHHQANAYVDAFLGMFLPSGSSAPNIPTGASSGL